MAEVLFLRFSLNTERTPSLLVAQAFAVPLLAALVGRLRGRRAGAAGLLAAVVWLAVPVVAAYLTSWRVPVFMHRYFMLIVPAYVLLLAAGLAALRWRGFPLGWVYGALIAGASLTAIATPAEVRPDFRGAAAYVAERVQPGDRAVFVAGYGARPFRYYLPDERLPGLEGPYTNDGADPAVSAAVLAGKLGDAGGRVWLVEFEEWLWDSRGVTFAWLAAHGRVADVAAFTSVRVTAVDLTAP
jgi:hypothetical protein